MELLERLLFILGPIFMIALAGYLYALKRRPNLEHVNQTNIELFTPLLIFSALSQSDIRLSEYLSLSMAAIGVVLLTGLLALPAKRLTRVAHKTFVPPMMFRNSGNLGLPLFLLAFGEEALPAAVILFVIENTLHFSLGMKILNPGYALINLLKMPMLQATVLGFLFAYYDWHLPAFLATSIEMLGQIAIPLMLFALGARLSSARSLNWGLGLVSALWAPVSGLLVALPLAWIFDVTGQQLSMLLIFSALPPAVLNFLVAEKYNQEPAKVASIVLVSNVLGMFVLSLVLAAVL